MTYLCLPVAFKPKQPAARKFTEFGKFYEVDWSVTVGRGGFSTVYKGRERSTGRIVAVKKIPRRQNTKNAGSSNKVLQQEINAAFKVKEHDYIVSLFDVFVAVDVVVLCMEYMEGDVLFQTIVKFGPLAENLMKVHFYNLAKALKHLHTNNIVHRDLKPENLMFSSVVDCKQTLETAQLKLTDFGLSKILPENAQMMRTFCGTPAYLAPEAWAAQFKGKHYDCKVDTWSYGVTLFVVLSGYHPFDPEGKAELKLLRKSVLDLDWGFHDPGWNGISPECKDLLSKLICPSDERLTANEILEHSWFFDVTEHRFTKKRLRKTLSQRIKALQLNSGGINQSSGYSGKKPKLNIDRDSRKRSSRSFLRLKLSSKADSKSKNRQIEVS